VAGPLNTPAVRARRDTSRALWKVLDHASGDQPAAEAPKLLETVRWAVGAVGVGATGRGEHDDAREGSVRRGRVVCDRRPNGKPTAHDLAQLSGEFILL
jgi:hypothetical protein